MDIAQIRIRRYKLHGSDFWVNVFHDPKAWDDSRVTRRLKLSVQNHVNHGCDIAGFAFVIWSSEGATSSVVINNSRIPGIVIPDLVRNKLLAEKIEEWTIESIHNAQ
jgi:hypothetical protein